MSWLRSSPLRHSLNRNGNNSSSSTSGGTSSTTTTNAISKFTTLQNNAQQTVGGIANIRQRPIDTATDCDPGACYDSFCKHWQQAHEIIQHSEPPHKPPTHDDVLGVVSHLDFMVTLLLVELHHCNKIALPTADNSAPSAPCLEFMLSENFLDKLYEWGCTTGRYANAVRLEQLKLYELLVSHSRHQLLCHEPFLRPLLKILASSQGEIFPPDLEKRLVILLNQLCVVLMQNVHLLDLFFFSAQAQVQERSTQMKPPKSGTTTNFIIFSLLIPYVHREGSLGHQARDALLLCMALSQKNSNIGTYIAQYSSMCPLLVTGLGGLYSRLPNSIEITSIDWHRITPDDVTEIAELTLFMNALEFCNAVVQVAHEMIKQQLLDFMYQGFIVPVLGPAILQKLNGRKHLQTNVDSQISAMSYLDLILRSITEPGLLRAFVRFLLDNEKFDGERILDTLVERLNSPDANLCMVTMALFDTLLGLHCEDLMLELMLKYMLPGKHVPISYRHKINKIDPYINSAEFFLELTPDVMKRARDLTKHKNIGETVAAQNNAAKQQQLQHQQHQQLTLPGTMPTIPSPTTTMSKTIGANWNYYGLYTGDSLYANIHAYLFEAHWRIAQCLRDCNKWANTYNYQKWPRNGTRTNAHTLELVKQFFSEFNISATAAAAASADATAVQQQQQQQQLHMLNIDSSDGTNGNGNGTGEKKQLDSLQSLGESSGYESFKWRPNDDEGVGGDDLNNTITSTTAAGSGIELLSNVNGNGFITGLGREAWRISHNRNDLLLSDLDFSEDLFAQGTVSLGPFLNAIWSKLQTFTSNTLYVNLHLTGLITRLAWYPLPLVHSLLLRPDIAITSDTPSFHQVLRILKQQIDAELPVTEDSLEIVDIARSYLIDREFRLANTRKASENSPLHQLHMHMQHGSNTQASVVAAQQQRSAYATISAATPVQATPTSAYDPFRRNDNKRRSISKSITSMFSRKSSSTATATATGTKTSTSSSVMSQGATVSNNNNAGAAAIGAVTSLVGTEANSNSATASSGGGNNQMERTKLNTTTHVTCETSLSTIKPTSDRRSSVRNAAAAAATASTSSVGENTTTTTSNRLLNTNALQGQGSPASSLGVGVGVGVGNASTTSGSTQTLSAHSNLTLTSMSSTLHGDNNSNSIGSGGGGGGGSGIIISNSAAMGSGYAGSEPVSLDSMSSMGVIANTSGTDRSRDLALCAVLLDEWLKELAAIAQEQSVVLVNNNATL